MGEDDLRRLRDDVRRNQRRASEAARVLAGSRHEVRALLVVEALDRAERGLSGVLADAGGPGGLYGVRATQERRQP